MEDSGDHLPQRPVPVIVLARKSLQDVPDDVNARLDALVEQHDFLMRPDEFFHEPKLIGIEPAASCDPFPAEPAGSISF